MPQRVAIDTETRGRLDLPRVGAPAYCAGAGFDLLGVGFSEPYARGGAEEPAIRLWSPFLASTDGQLASLRTILANPEMILVGANALEFDRYVIEAVAVRYGLPIPDAHRWVHDVAPRARAINRPGSLGQMVEALTGHPIKESALGKKLIKRFSMPNKMGEFCKPSAFPSEFAQLLDPYLTSDVRATIVADRFLPELSAAEQEVLLAIADMNRAGVPLDKLLAQAIARIAEQIGAEAHAIFVNVTDGLAPTQTIAFKHWLNIHGLPVAGVGAEELAKALIQLEDKNDPRRIAIEARQAAAMSSLSKAAKAATHPEPSRRSEFIYNKARSRRIIANGLQVQNFPRGSLGDADLGLLRELVKRSDLATIRAAGFDPAAAAQQCLRSMVRARPGYTLIVFDFGRIEFAVLMHLSSADHLNQADPYVALASVLHKVSVGQVTKEQRQKAKAVVLGSGYALSPTGYMNQTGCSIAEAQIAIGAWRRTFSPALRFWNELQDAAAATALRGTPQSCAKGRVVFEKRGRDLVCMLPSGEGVYYPEIQAAAGERYGKTVVDMSCMTMANGQWVRRAINLPTLIENCVSSTARDLLREALVQASMVWQPIMIVHDEIVLEVPTALADVAYRDLEWLMTTPVPWLPGFTPSAEGFISEFYRK